MIQDKPTLYKITDAGIEMNFHPAQTEAWESQERIIAMLCGTQVGKTEFAVQWMKREIDNTYKKEDKNNDYIVATSNFPLLDRKLQPEFLHVFKDIYNLGTFLEGKRIFKFHDKNIRVFLCSADNPDSLEASTVKAALLDEAGQDSFPRQSWDAIWRRLNITQGRILITTTIYNFGWLKTEVYDRWKKGDKTIKVIHADSILNPAFPREAWDIAQKTMPQWKFDMQYRGLYSRPAGMIYDCFDASQIKSRFPIPPEWNCYVGMDFGSESTAAMFYALEPTTGVLWAYQEYDGGKKPVQEHVEKLKELQGTTKIVKACGGIKSEQGWRNDFGHYGWVVRESPIRDVEQGILKVYALHKAGKLMVFDDLHTYIDQKQKYSRELDENNNYMPTDKIKDKEWQHLMDAERYILSTFEAVSPSNQKVVIRSYV